ncbi:ABC transporter ATP-binding protein [Gloeocapsopsis crepidinum LEGE 06123]|uniref:ABC transporter ATP-binding protein n=1 Tax=Gloeocapsopsis crepidinum LEGE 06123 TaxID=588587 RepID=A0ABR9ULE6_9CHRO|nr:ABC transporter ATP-binding protein [Gloeocapsopsis crepidinum]MBE9189105.1 ABC transporter ATP-binding protein [Gloeocapsopsis crepidinum LEGE 06123]
MVRMEAITKTYCLGEVSIPVLKQVDLSIAQGDYVAIMGASGSGKSTLMNIVGCLDRPTTGEYFLEGKNLTTLNEDELAYIRNQHIGFVFQQFHLLSRATALENVMLPMVYANLSQQEQHQRAIQALTSVGLSEHLAKRPNQLSGGQQQRVAFARALVNQPAMILADEPTGALDTKTSQDVMHLLQELNEQGITIVIVTHDRDVAAQAKWIIHLQDGSVVNQACNSRL